ncbi:MAG TPA: hypothetical protein VD768_03045 [Sphingomicrobium sp.]|nr:hypothetical protein [Sphingomicrobium sp.]
MARLEAARQRLERAIDRLERAVADRAGRTGGEDPQLRVALDDIRRDYDALQEVTRTVRQRLDVAIHRLENLLEQ